MNISKYTKSLYPYAFTPCFFSIYHMQTNLANKKTAKAGRFKKKTAVTDQAAGSKTKQVFAANIYGAVWLTKRAYKSFNSLSFRALSATVN